MNDSEPAGTIVRCLMVGFVRPWTAIHATVVLGLEYPTGDA